MINKNTVSAGNSKIFVDYDELPVPPQNIPTLKSLGKELEKGTDFTKKDFEQALEKVSRKVKK
jgi:hypothetical protein